MTGAPVLKQKRKMHETKSGSKIVEVKLTDRQYKSIKANKTTMIMVNNTLLKVTPPVSKKTLRKIATLKAEIAKLQGVSK